MTTALTAANAVDVELVDAFGLPAEGVTGVALVLSRVLGEHGISLSRYLCRLLRAYAHAPVTLAGQTLPAPCPDVERPGYCPQGPEVAARFEVTAQGFRDLYRRHKLLHGSDVPLDLDMLRAFVPAELWRVLVALIADGPELAGDRVNVALAIEAETPIRRDRRHRSDAVTPSQSALSGVAGAARAVFRSLVALGLSPALSGPLQRWQRVPPVSTPVSQQTPGDTTAPARWRVRELWQRLDADIGRRLPDGYADELEAIASMTADQMRRSGLFLLLRIRVVVMLMVVCGMRVGAISRLKVGHYLREWPCPDGEQRPAIAARPGKTRRDEWVSPKPLPTGAAAVIETYLAYMTRRLGPLDPDGPLLHAGIRDRPFRRRDITKAVGGVTGRQRALIPRGADPTHGYTCHPYRSACAQMLRSLEAHEWLAANRISASQHWLAEALLDHALAGLDALYGGASKDEDRERLTIVATELTWRMLTTDLGARRGPDGNAYRAALQARLALHADVDELAARIDASFASAEAPRRREVTIADLMASIEGLTRVHALVRIERTTRDELAAVERELELLRADPAKQVPLADRADAAPDDLEAIEAGVLAGGSLRRRRAAKRRRQWWGVQEFAGAIDVSPATLPRWLGQAGRPPQLPFGNGDPRNPWRADRVPIDDSLGARRRRILVDGLSEAWLAADPARTAALEALLTTPGPEGWSEEQCATPLAKPAWMC